MNNKLLPIILMAAGALGVLVDVFYMAGWQRGVLVASAVSFGVGYFWDKFSPGK